ncbi:MAG: DUF1501 domain-containing protein [Mycobacteriales bacterium]
MDTITRRKFLVASGVVGAGALAAGAAEISWRDVATAAKNDPLPSDAQVLVLVTLCGGNDSLNTLIPYADPAYQKARPGLAYPADKVLRLDDQLGLNPAMKTMHALWSEHRLAVIRGVGYPRPDHSHFRSMDIWQTASPDRPVSTGWIGRWLDAVGSDPLKVVSIGATPQPLVVGAKAIGSSLPTNRFGVPKGAARTALKGLGRTDSADSAAEAAAAAGDADFLTVARTFGPMVNADAPDPADGSGQNQSQGASGGGQSSLAAQLAVVGRCVKAGAPTRVYAVSLGGFDTHAEEAGTQERLLGEFDTAVGGFLDDMAKDTHGRKVVLAAYSEFGRRVAANASDGTDHGTAGTVFIARSSVHGGFYGEQPSLTKLDDGDLIASTDFRAVYGTLLSRVLDTDPGKVLDSVKAPINFV